MIRYALIDIGVIEAHCLFAIDTDAMAVIVGG